MPRRARQRASGAVDEPNLVIPLATSINERGVQGFTHMVTNSEDQRKINVFYEIARNAATGKGTLTLSKRPGVTVDAGNYGTSTSSATWNPYLLILLTGQGTGKPSGALVPVSIGVDVPSAIIYSSTNGVNSSILGTIAQKLPAYVSKTAISGTENIVVQIQDNAPNGLQRVFFSTNATAWTEIVDGDFPSNARGQMVHMDGFAFVLEDTSNKIWNSDVNSLANWTATSFISKQASQDSPVGLAKLDQHILAFGDDTAEVFYNAGNTTGSPLIPIKQLQTRIGMIPPFFNNRYMGSYYCVIGKQMFFIGRNSGGVKSAGAYVYNGQGFEKISTPYIDKILSEIVSSSFYSVNAVSHHGKTAVGIALTSPTAASQRWLMFYPEWKEWFEWTSDVIMPITDGQFFLSCGASAKNKLYKFDSSDVWQDDTTSYAWSTQFKLPLNGASTKFMPMYGVDADTDTTTNDLTVEISTVDPQTFTTLGTIDQTQTRKVLFEGGSFTEAWIRLGNTNARPTRIHNWLSRIE